MHLFIKATGLLWLKLSLLKLLDLDVIFTPMLPWDWNLRDLNVKMLPTPNIVIEEIMFFKK